MEQSRLVKPLAYQWLYSVILILVLPIAKPVFAEFGLEQVELRAQLAPVRYTTLSAEFGAQITHLDLNEGAVVEENSLLVSFDCSLQRAQLAKAQAALAGARNLYEGNKNLAELGAIGQVELRSAEIEVQKARADIGYLSALLSKCDIKAPFSGRVASVAAQPGQYVQPGQPLLEIFDDRQLELAFIVPSKWIVWFKVGSEFQVIIEDTGKTYPAKLVRTSGKADPVSQSVRAFAQIDGNFPELIAGMSGRLLIEPPVQ